MMIVIWIVIIVALVILEAISTQLIGIWFAVAALIALVLAMLEAEIWVQVVVFIVASAILLLSTRSAVRKLLKNAPEHTNADRAVGETAIVIEQIDNDTGTGQVKVLGQTWSAKSQDGSIIPVDEKTIVTAIDGVKLIVELEKPEDDEENVNTEKTKETEEAIETENKQETETEQETQTDV